MAAELTWFCGWRPTKCWSAQHGKQPDHTCEWKPVCLVSTRVTWDKNSYLRVRTMAVLRMVITMMLWNEFTIIVITPNTYHFFFSALGNFLNYLSLASLSVKWERITFTSWSCCEDSHGRGLSIQLAGDCTEAQQCHVPFISSLGWL